MKLAFLLLVLVMTLVHGLDVGLMVGLVGLPFAAVAVLLFNS